MRLRYTSTPHEGRFRFECGTCDYQGWAPFNTEISHFNDCKGPMVVKELKPDPLVLPCTKFSQGGSITVKYDSKDTTASG